ncbi:MAG: hypothetical protein H0X29_00235 [Parachlamydiaceae bacterium]|nr:hypothetical protein [Parachlamydiaceae bacterium]
MVIYRFPPDSNGEESSKNTSKKQSNTAPISPDFIYVDEVSPRKEQWESLGGETPKGGFTGQTGYPFFLRLLTLLISGILTLWIGVLVVLFLITTAISAILLFRSPSAIQTMKSQWKSIGSVSAYALALFVATINPAFGFGIFALYALQSGESAEKMPFGKMFQGHF